jgi:hypothetical protein
VYEAPPVIVKGEATVAMPDTEVLLFWFSGNVLFGLRG